MEYMKTKKALRKKSLFDGLVSKKLKEKRNFSGFSVKFMAERLGVSFQQYSKYENGTNRISAGNLYELCSKLGWDIKDFFDNSNNVIENIEGVFTAQIIKFGTLLAKSPKEMRDIILDVISNKN